MAPTLEQLINSDKAAFSPGDVAGVLGCDPHTLSLTARQKPERIRFPFYFSGNRMKIPKVTFLRFLGIE